MGSLLAGIGLFCGAGNRDGGSGGRTGGLLMLGFSVDLVLDKALPSLGVRLFWKEGARFTETLVSPFAKEDSKREFLSGRLGGKGLAIRGIRGGGSLGASGLVRCWGLGLGEVSLGWTGPSF